MKNKHEKGAIAFDKICHRIFDAKDNGFDYLARPTGVHCCHCGHELNAYYCEERLYIVKCDACGIFSLVKAENPREAAYKTIAFPVEDVDNIYDGCAVFFSHVPIDEPPVYVGSVEDTNFPADDVVCGMYLPCPGTDGSELAGKEKED